MIGKANFVNRKVRTIKKELLINGGDLDLYLDLFLTDENGKTEKILTKKSDSIVTNFLRILYLQMGRDPRDNVMGGTFYRRRTTSTNITSIGSGNGNKFRLTFGSSVVSSSETVGKIALGGFQGITLDGTYSFTRISDAVIDVDGTTYSAGWTSGTGGAMIFVPVTSLGNPSYQSFAANTSSTNIHIGTGTTPVVIDDFSLEKPIPSLSTSGGLTYNTGTISQDTNDTTSAQITFTKTFTNNTSLTTQVNEISLFMECGTLGYELMVMRDIIPDGVNVAAGKTLTVNYRIKNTLGTGTDPGGFVASFMRLLYRQSAQTGRAIFDIDNVSVTLGQTNASFLAVKCGGESIEYAGLAEIPAGYKHGIIIGRGNTPTSMGDYYLESLIGHGVGTNQMLYYGGFADDFEVGVDYAQFSISKAIENNSGNTIQINEYGLTGGSGGVTSTSDTIVYYNPFVEYLYLLARNVLTEAVDVPDQQILKVVYTIKILIGDGGSA